MTAADGPAPLTVHEAWSRVMGDVRALAKDGVNKQGSGYKFRGIDAVMNAVGPALRAHGVVVVPAKVKHHAIVDVLTGNNRTPMASARVSVVYRVSGPLGDSFKGAAVGEAFDSGDKATAKAMSVAYRTFLLQALTLPTDDPDPDSATHHRSPAVDEAEMARDLGKWTGEVKAAGTDLAKLKALWDRLAAEFPDVPWSPEREAILNPAIKAAREHAAQHPEDPTPDDAGDQDQDEEQAFLLDLQQCEEAGDVQALRGLVKKAIDMRRSDLRQKAAAAANTAADRKGKK